MEAISSVTTSYAQLFNKGSEETNEENEEQGSEEEFGNGTSTNDATEIFNQKWSWFYLIDQVSELTRESWDNVLKKNIYEFLNLVCYLKDKRAMEKNEIDKMKNGTRKF